ncbi:MAG: nucleotidyl transferase AbiEii/AbiGii toxin family protein [Deltaproteobacteria bacterium]|nr:nucleotidyl transferase AbiEii/AbiGii toxin family protein [Deltaproteobacteria bacterium]
MALDLVAELEALVDALHAEGVDYALCGALALAVHGHPRATKDIDLLVCEPDLARALAVARRLGFEIPAAPMTFGAGTPRARRVRRVSKPDDQAKQLLPLDLVLVGPVFETVWHDRVLVRWRERDLVVVSRDGLVAMKRIASRTQDVADLEKLEGKAE